MQTTYTQNYNRDFIRQINETVTSKDFENLTGIQFKQVGGTWRSRNHGGGIVIYKTKTGYLSLKCHKVVPGLVDGDYLQQIAHYNSLDRKENFKQVLKIAAFNLGLSMPIFNGVQKESIVENILLLGEVNNPQNTKLFKFEVSFKNGDSGIYYSINEDQNWFIIGRQTKYFLKQTENGNIVKPEYPKSAHKKARNKKEVELNPSSTHWIPNKEGTSDKVNLSYTYKVAHDSHPAAQAFLKYWRKKTSQDALTFATLAEMGVFPLLSRTYKTGRTELMSASNFGFATVAGQNVKFKFPNNSKDSGQLREITAQSIGNRVFGWDQLPEKGFAVVFLGGETDTISFNLLMKPSKVYGITLNSENQNIPSDLVNQLSKRFNHIFTCFDNDTTGRKSARKQAKRVGVPAIRLWKYSEENDVCDFIQKHGKQHFINATKLEISTTKTILKRPNDPFSITVPHAVGIQVDKYLSETKATGLSDFKPLFYLKQFIQGNKKLLISLNAGGGKTTGIIQLALNRTSQNTQLFKSSLLEQLGATRTIVCTPTQGLAQQLQAKIETNYKVYAPVVDGNFSYANYQEIKASPIIITTYDSLKKLTHLVPESLLVIDECHALTDWTAFKLVVNNQVLELAQESIRTVAISATPDLRLCTELHPFLEFTLCKVSQKNPQKLKVQPIYYGNKTTETDLFYGIMQKHESGNTGTTLIKKDGLDLLKTEKEVAEVAGYSYDIFSSKERRFRDDNANYQSIINNDGILASETDFIGATSLTDFGLNYNFIARAVHFINERSSNSLVQFSSRPRFNRQNNINSEIQVYSYRKTPKESVTQNSAHTLSVLESELMIAKLRAERANQHKEENPIQLMKSGISLIYWSTLHGRWLPNVLGLIFSEVQREHAESTPTQFYERLAANHDNVEIMEPQIIDFTGDGKAKELKKELKEKRKAEEAEALNILENEPLPIVLESIYRSSANASLKKKIRKEVKIRKTESPAAYILQEENPNLFAAARFDKHLSKFFILKNFAIPKKKRIEIIRYFFDNDDCSWSEFINSFIAGIELTLSKNYPDKLTGQSMERVKEYQKILSEFDSNIGEELLFRQVEGKLLKCLTENIPISNGRTKNIERTLSPQKIRQKIMDLYAIEVKRSGQNKLTKYILKRRQDPFAILKKNGVFKKAFFDRLISYYADNQTIKWT